MKRLLVLVVALGLIASSAAAQYTPLPPTASGTQQRQAIDQRFDGTAPNTPNLSSAPGVGVGRGNATSGTNAIVGDGVTNNPPNIQAALNTMSSGQIYDIPHSSSCYSFSNITIP